MFAGFNVHIEHGYFSDFFEYGNVIYKKQRETIENNLADYIVDGRILDASRIEDDWFPEVEADVFISHSHKDEKLAIGLAGWLHKLFGITSFIDSCVWGYSDELLRIIDEEYCVNKRKPNGSVDTFDYNKRNQSTAHVHMILNAALHKMIDKTECLMFLSTPHSLITNGKLDKTATASPWIYSELTFSLLCRKKKLAEYRTSLAHGHIYEHSQLSVKYDVSLSHLVDLHYYDFMDLWKNNAQRKPTEALDYLYNSLHLLNSGG